MKKNIKILLIILFIIVAMFTLIFYAGKNMLPSLLGTPIVNETNTAPVVKEKLLDQKAPEFSLPDISGNIIALSSYINTPVVLVFWATWNNQSADQIKIFDDYLLSKNVQTSLIKVISIDSLEDASIVKSFMQRGAYSVPVGEDITGNISNNYNIKSLPTTYFIDKEGIVREIYTGVLSGGMLVDKVENLLK